MAEAIVSFLAVEISLFLHKEEKLLGAVREDAVSISHELAHMRAFRREAEVIEEPAASELSVWVKGVMVLMEIAFDIEDTLDEYKLHLRCDERVAARICVISRFIRNLKYRREIACRIQHLKSRTIELQVQRYQLSIRGASSTNCCC